MAGQSIKLSISLPAKQAEQVQALANSGRYASVSAVISDSLRALEARDASLARWLQDEVVPAYRELRNDPSTGQSMQQARAKVGARRRRQG